MKKTASPPHTAAPDQDRASLDTLDSILANHPEAQPIIVDFDGTLLLRNSTEAYLDSAWPRQIAAFFLAFLDAAKPWRLLPGAKPAWIYSDWIRIVTITVLLPWSALLWRWRAARVARLHVNASLMQRLALRPAGSVSVATFGFRFVVSPLLAAIAPAMTLVVASPFLDGYRLRRTGKAVALERAIGADALAASLVITDSMDDADLAPLSAGLAMIDCPEEAHRRALQDCYVPFHYLNTAKRPGENHVLRQILYQDLVILWISYAVHSASPVLTGAALIFLQISYWMIYEIGYWENDVLGARWETRPVIRDGFARSKDRFSPWWAWGLASAVALAAAALLSLGGATHIAGAGLPATLALAILLGAWVGYLCCVRGLYWLYNRIDPVSRVFVYPILQVTKNLGFAVLLPISLVGAVLCASVTIARWIPYIVYRYGGQRWETPNVLIHLALFNFLLLVVAVATGRATPFLQPEVWFIEAWICFHARKQVATLVRSFVWLPGRGE